MQAKEQVTSLDLSVRLKDLDVPQQSIFSWVRISSSLRTQEYHLVYTSGEMRLLPQKHNDVAAFTVAELGELLPRCYMSWATPQNGEMKWWCRRMESHFVTHEETPTFTASTEADARAKMLISLLEQGHKP